MAFSQNARFVGRFEDLDADEHPPGSFLADVVSAALRASGWTVSEIDNWRDVGWCFNASQDGSELQVVVSGLRDQEWMLQVAPARGGGLLNMIFRRAPSASVSDCFEAAGVVHDTLRARGAALLWRWNGPPDEANGTSEPRERESAS